MRRASLDQRVGEQGHEAASAARLSVDDRDHASIVGILRCRLNRITERLFLKLCRHISYMS